MSTPGLPAPAPAVPVPETVLASTSAGRGRPSWSGLIKLGLLAVPVKAYPATATAPELPCHQLHAGCGRRVRYEKRCPEHGPLEAGAIVKGYECAPGQFCVLDEAELDKLRPPRDRALELDCFLDAEPLDPVLFSGRSLYLAPDGPAAQQAYTVLAQAMRQRRKAALGRVVLSGRRQLVLVRPAARLLVLHLLHFPAQLRGPAALEADLRPATVGAAEDRLAEALIDTYSRPVTWANYRDDSAERLAALVEAKLRGGLLTTPAPEETPVLSLLDALRQSVSALHPPPAAAAPPTAGMKGEPRSTQEVCMIEPFLPMLAVKAEPFDSPEYLFEVKWDGVRALAGRDADGWCLWGRDRADYRARYPELGVLAGLPAGTVLDGELVLWAGSVPDRDALLARHPRTSVRAVSALSRQQPVSYVVFDAPYDRGRCLFGQPLRDRRTLARECVEQLADPRLAFSEGIVATGKAFFEEVVGRGQEGVMAKHLSSRYLSGRRSASWKKIKPSGCLPAVIIGYLPGRHGVRGLFVAALRDGALRYVAHLRSGLSDLQRRQLAERLATRVRPQPAVPCSERGVWVEPELYCQVRFLAWTRRGRLLGASFHGLLDSGDRGAAGRAGVPL